MIRIPRFTALAVLLTVSSFNIAANSVDCSVVDNVVGYTPIAAAKELKTFSWLAFADGKVIAVGSANDAKPKCKIIDGQGNYALPGLIDAHGHVSKLGYDLLRVKLRGLSSEAISTQAVKDFAANNPNTQWVLGRGWNQTLWASNEFPTFTSLDATGIDRPVYLERVDGHAGWANRKAMALAGITDHTPDPLGGKIIRDVNGKATGIFIDNAMVLVEDNIPAPSAVELELAFDKAYEHLLSLGIVSTHDAGVSQTDLDSYMMRVNRGKLPVRIYGMLSATSDRLYAWLKAGRISDGKDFLSVRSVKLYSDGALGSRGAALLESYSDDAGNHGLLLTDPPMLDKLVEDIIAAGFQANIHAIGDYANRISLSAIEKAYIKTDGRELRNRIEHTQVVASVDFPKFLELNVIASMQPVHATSDKNMAADRLGEDRLAGAYAWQRFLQQGTVVASGSDFPVELANPFHGLHAATTRQDHDNMPTGGWLMNEAMTPAQALRSFTLGAAYAAHQEDVLGSLEQGKWADFILVDQDVVNGVAMDTWKTKVVQTWIAGELVYQQ
ncbi:MAG: putative amidohydrolase YtcJ [Chitinophagales bacterium]|jgi:predicted amidohydrolase YtcJ